jgi:hypothetical protein
MGRVPPVAGTLSSTSAAPALKPPPFAAASLTASPPVAPPALTLASSAAGQVPRHLPVCGRVPRDRVPGCNRPRHRRGLRRARARGHNQLNAGQSARRRDRCGARRRAGLSRRLVRAALLNLPRPLAEPLPMQTPEPRAACLAPASPPACVPNPIHALQTRPTAAPQEATPPGVQTSSPCCASERGPTSSPTP